MDNSGWDYGAPLADVKRLAQYWHSGFDWRAYERKLNELPNFHKPIKADGFPELDVHYLHQKSQSPDAIPLLFVHVGQTNEQNAMFNFRLLVSS